MLEPTWTGVLRPGIPKGLLLDLRNGLLQLLVSGRIVALGLVVFEVLFVVFEVLFEVLLVVFDVLFVVLPDVLFVVLVVFVAFNT